MKPFVFLNIDVVPHSVCNLSCPSCPTGRKEHRQAGFMKEELLDAILSKACGEAKIIGVALYNWTEPFLHPDLPAMVSCVHKHDCLAQLSSNLSIERIPNLPRVFEQHPDRLRISCSGFTQAVYEIGHRGGNVETVKRNMRTIAAVRGLKTKVDMLWHQYRHNAHEEPLMREYCESLGFAFHPIPAYVMPIERVLDIWDGRGKPLPIAGNLLTSLDEHKRVVQGRSMPCKMQEREITIDSKGMVQLCCAVHDPSRFTLSSFLDTPLAEIQGRMKKHSFCDRCISKGGHIYIMGYSLREPPALGIKEPLKKLLSLFPQRVVTQVSKLFP